MIICKNKLLVLKRKTWYYEIKDNEKRKNKGYPDGGFLNEGDSILVCNVDFTFDGVIKANVLHSKKNIIQIVYQSGDERYYFHE